VQYVTLGSSGLEVSRLCLGCMSYGDPTRSDRPWVLSEEKARPFIQRAIELGINFFDTANTYSDGTSEEIVGRALADYARRDEIVIATKVRGRMHAGPNGEGLSRKAIMAEIDNSLRRLRTAYVDLYQIHRWDSTTRIEETLEALRDVVRAGKARYIGASSMWAWQFAKSLYVADLHGWLRFASMQDQYNLLNREAEREMLPLCAAEGVGVMAWSPLARGHLTREWDAPSERSRTDEFYKSLYPVPDADRQVLERVLAVAAAREIPPAQVALAWLLQKPIVTAPVIGATTLAHLDDAVAALGVALTADEIASLEKPYVPHPVVGFS
jgi:aryl-alcohol dehydrogenase-like predicted oxidoreductase